MIITRHAKTVPGDGQMADFDRFLTNRGHKDPVLVSKELLNLGVTPDVIVSSPAKRAHQTAEIFADSFQIPADNIELADFLYGYFSIDSLMAFLQSKADQSSCVQVIGHNPKMVEIAADLTASIYRNLPTSGTQVLEFYVNSWDHISEGSGTLIHYIYPKSLRGGE